MAHEDREHILQQLGLKGWKGQGYELPESTKINKNRSGAKWKAELEKKDREKEARKQRVKKRNPDKCEELADIAAGVGTITENQESDDNDKISRRQSDNSDSELMSELANRHD